MEYMKEIYISGETYSKMLRKKFNLYSSYSCPLFRDYTKTRRIKWEEYKDFTV